MRPSPEKRAAAAIFALLLLAASQHAEFTLRALSVFMNVNQDGSVNVEEHLDITMNGSSRKRFEIRPCMAPKAVPQASTKRMVGTSP